MTDRIALLSIGIVVLVCLYIGVELVTMVIEAQSVLEARAEWCRDQGGTVHNARVVGSQGGSYCDLPGEEPVPFGEIEIQSD